MNILILGPCGAGKSYLANKISQMSKANSFSLDHLANTPNYLIPTKTKQEITEKIKKQRIKKIFENTPWVIGGSYPETWINPLIKKADKIIILNPKHSIIKKRIILRVLKRNLNWRKKPIVNRLSVLVSPLTPYKKARMNVSKYEKLVISQKKKPIMLSTKKQINGFLKNIKK